MIGLWFNDDYHQSYAGSPYARAEAIEVLEGGEGFDGAAALDILRKKRTPWEIDESLRSHDLDFLGGGAYFPNGIYELTMEDLLVHPNIAGELGRDFHYPWTAFGYTYERRATNYGVMSTGPWTWLAFPPFNDGALTQRSVRISGYRGAMEDPADYEANGLRVRFATGGATIVGVFARIGVFEKADHPHDPNETVLVNPTVAHFPEDPEEREYTVLPHDAAH